MFTALNWNILYGDLNIFRSVLPISPYEYEIYKYRRFEMKVLNFIMIFLFNLQIQERKSDSKLRCSKMQNKKKNHLKKRN